MKIKAEDLWPLVLDFIETYIGKDELKAFKKYFKVEVEKEKDPLVKLGGIKALLETFLKNNKKALKAFKASKKQQQQKDDDSSSSESEKEKSKKKTTLAGSKRKRADSKASDAGSTKAKKR